MNAEEYVRTLEGTGKAYAVVVTDDRIGGPPRAFAGAEAACSTGFRTFRRAHGIIRATAAIYPLDGLLRQRIYPGKGGQTTAFGFPLMTFSDGFTDAWTENGAARIVTAQKTDGTFPVAQQWVLNPDRGIWNASKPSPYIAAAVCADGNSPAAFIKDLAETGKRLMEEYARERRAEAAAAVDEATKAEREAERLDPDAEAAKTELAMSTAGIT